MRALRRKKTDKPNVNFLTCSGVPALGPGVEVGANRENGGQMDDGAVRQMSDKANERRATDDGRREIEGTIEMNKTTIQEPDARRPTPDAHSLRRRIVKWSLGLFILALLAFSLPATVALIRTAIAGSSAKSSIQTMANRFEGKDVKGAREALDQAKSQVQTAKDSLKGASYWRDLPGIGTQIRALEDASDSGSQALSAAQSVMDVMDAVLGAAQTGESAIEGANVEIDPNRSFKELSPEEKRALLARLDRALPDLREAEAKIDVAVDAWNRIPQDRLFTPLRKAFEPIAEHLPRLKKTIDEAEPLIEIFVPLAGYPKPATYLVLLQNSDEIRPTGGFIGTVGRLTIDAGEIKEFEFQDVYAVDNPASGAWKDVPPEPIKKYLGIPVWYFRDSNWSPDFPTSAERLLDAYVRERAVPLGSTPAKPDGIIAINPPLFTQLMKIAGPITVDGLTFDSNNYFDLLEYQVEEGWLEKGIPVDKRKAILSRLGDELLSRLSSLPASKWSDLADVLTDTLNRRQTMVYVTRPDVLSRLDSKGWTGRVKQTNDDYLWVVDANLAALKTDEVMEKNITYSIDATHPEEVTATVTLRYTNHATRLATGASDNFKHTRYRSYTRVYVPEGAQLISSEGSMKDDRYRTGGRAVPGSIDVMKDLGKTVFGAFWSIEPNTTQELSFTYRLPKAVVDNLNKGSYSLDWQKQSGVDDAGLTLDLSFGKTLKSASPPEVSSEWGDGAYRVEVNSLEDRQFSVTF